MPFEAVERESVEGPPRLASITLKRRAKAQHVSCIVTIKKALAAQLEQFLGAKPFCLMLGGGADSGLARISVDTVRTTGWLAPLKLGGLRLDCGFVKAFPDEEKAKVEIEARMISASMVELVLPKWSEVPAPEARASDDEEDDEPEPAPRPKVNGAAGRPTSRTPLPRRPDPPPPAPAPRTTSSRSNGGVPISREGVLVTFEPPEISFNGQSLGITQRQAAFLRTLVRGFGGIMVTADILEAMPEHVGASEIFDDFRELQGPLGAIKLRLGHQKNFGYILNKQ